MSEPPFECFFQDGGWDIVGVQWSSAQLTRPQPDPSPAVGQGGQSRRVRCFHSCCEHPFVYFTSDGRRIAHSVERGQTIGADQGGAALYRAAHCPSRAHGAPRHGDEWSGPLKGAGPSGRMGGPARRCRAGAAGRSFGRGRGGFPSSARSSPAAARSRTSR